MELLRRLAKSRLNPLWYKYAIGGKWNEIGKLQFDFMVEQGLKPEHYLLDIGCGSLRGGLHFIRYLYDWHYTGIDCNVALLKTGEKLILKNGLGYKNPELSCLNNFEFKNLYFDYALAWSLFTHLTVEQIRTCIENVKPILSGKFFATFFESDRPEKINYDTFAYPFWQFQRICLENDLRVERINDFIHPRGQKMMVITRGG